MNDKKYLLISPHFDDIFLSVFSLLYSKPEEIMLVNVFTSIDYTQKLSRDQINCLAEDLRISREIVSSDSLKNWIKYREQENHIACKKVGVEYINLGFADSLFRLTKNDEELKIDILEKIKEFNFETIIFPMGIGKHKDHLILHEISKDLFFRGRVLYYFDSPYFGKSELDFKKSKRLNDEIYSKKIEILNEFKTQVNWLKKETDIDRILRFERISDEKRD